MRSFLVAAATAALAAGAAFPASAAIVQFTNVKATWLDPDGGSGYSYSGNGSENATIKWGTPSGQPNKSGYNFTSPEGGLTFEVNAPAASAIGTLGTFTHFNNPISSGTGINGVQLKFQTDVLIDSVFYNNVTFYYDFSHWETPNGAEPCANGGKNGKGINVNGCADRVQSTFNSQSDDFVISLDGVDYHYALDVVGFLVGGHPMTEFWTKENADNTAYLRAAVRLYSEAGTPIGGVPEPASWALLISGFGLVGTSLRRRNRHSRSVAA